MTVAFDRTVLQLILYVNCLILKLHAIIEMAFMRFWDVIIAGGLVMP